MHLNKGTLKLLHLVVMVAFLVGACAPLSGSSQPAAPNVAEPESTTAPAAASVKDVAPQSQAQEDTASTETAAPTAVTENEPTPTTAPQQTVVSEQETPESSTATEVAVKPTSVASKPAAKRGDPLERPYRPTKAKLALPAALPDRSVQLRIEGFTTYLWAVADGRRSLVLTRDASEMPGMSEKWVTLSPDNRTVTFVTHEEPLKSRMKMWTVGIDGSNKREILDIPHELWTARPEWSPDSRRIAYVRAASPGKKPGLELWVTNSDGSGNRKLLSHPSFNTDLFYGPDPRPFRWTEYGDIQYRDVANGRVWTVDGETGALSYQKAKLDERKVKIPVMKTESGNPIPAQSQNDPRWIYDRAQSCGDTMGNVACAITAVSMSFNALGVETDPAKLNRDMGDFACPIYWSWASRKLSNNKLDMWGVWQFDWYSLDLSLMKGRPALVWLSDGPTLETSFLTHWVLVVGGGGQEPGGYRIYDPWDGTTYKTLEYYTSKGYDLYRVYSYAVKPPKKATDKATTKKSEGKKNKKP